MYLDSLTEDSETEYTALTEEQALKKIAEEMYMNIVRMIEDTSDHDKISELKMHLRVVQELLKGFSH